MLASMHATTQEVLAGIALIILGFLSVVMTFEVVPAANHDYMLIMLGALAGALTVSGGQKIADKITSSTGPNTITVPTIRKPSTSSQ